MLQESANFLKHYFDQYYALRGLIVSDYEGVHICSQFAAVAKEEGEKYIQTSTMLISAFNQTNGSLMKVHSLEKVHSVNFYYVDHLIHISHLRNIFIVLFMTENTHINNAKEIASDVLKAYDKLNAEIVQLKSNC